MEMMQLLNEAGAWKKVLSFLEDGVNLMIHPMDYPFIKPNAFRRYDPNDLKNFASFIKRFAFHFMTGWVKNTKDDSLGKSLVPTLDAFFGFTEDLSLKEVYEKIIKGEDSPAEIHLPISNAVLMVKRFGDSLGMKLKSGNQRSEDVHVNGTKLLTEMCYSDKLPIHVIEFLHSIECIVPVSKEHGENNSTFIDLNQIFDALNENCPGIFFDTESSEIINGYIAMETKRIGQYCHGKLGGFSDRFPGSGLAIKAGLIHYKASEMSKSEQWRKGNVEKLNGDIFRFSDSNDLCLSISINTGLPESTFMKDIDVNLPVADQQFALRKAGAALYLQLCAQALLK